MADVSAIEHNVEKPVFQNSINYDDTILNCNLLDIINVSGELEVILEGYEENSNVTNRDTPIKQPKMIHRSLQVRVATSL